MSANIGNTEKGLGTAPSSPSWASGSSAITRDATAARTCGHLAAVCPGNVPAVVASAVGSGTRRRVYVRGARGGLGWCVADRLRQLDSVDVIVASGDAPAEAASGHCDTVVDVGLADHDLLGRRGESVTEGAAELL